jgi:sRNA-binding regulator protein Hfq
MEPITGILRGFNPYELLIEVGHKQVIVFKRAIWDIEILG